MTNKKHIVLTGCSKGLGKALTSRFIAAGHHVYASARSKSAIDALNEQYESQGSFSVVDVSDIGAVERWCSSIIELCGSPDIVINNAAVINGMAPLWKVPTREFQQLVNINIVGVHNVISHLVPAMVKSQRGIIINLSSGWGRSVSPDVAPYCASKWAIEGLSKALATELPEGMACIPLSPGIIDTDMLRGAWGEGATGYRSADVWAKKAAPFILSLDATHNGQSLTTPE